MNYFSRLLEIIFRNAVTRLILWFLLGAIFAILLIRIFRKQPRGSTQQKALHSMHLRVTRAQLQPLC